MLVVLLASAAGAEEVQLVTGEVLRGGILSQNEQTLVMDHPVLGRLQIPMASVLTVRSASVEERQMLPPAQPVAPQPPIGPAIVPPVFDEGESGWTTRLELGLNGTGGSSQTSSVRAAIVGTHRTDQHVYTLDTRYAVATSRGDRSENRFTAGARGEWPTARQRLSYFAEGRYDYDEFNFWEHRVTAGGGLTYRLVDLKRRAEERLVDVFNINFKLGGGAKREFSSTENDIQPEGIVGGDLTWHITDRQYLTVNATAYPGFADSGEFRFVAAAEWVHQLDWADGLSLKLGVADEYQSRTDGPVPNNTITAYASLVLDF